MVGQFVNIHSVLQVFPGRSVIKNPPANAGDTGDASSVFPWVGKIVWRRAWQPIPVLLPGNSHEQRSLVGYSLWSRKESGTSEHTYSFLLCLFNLCVQPHQKWLPKNYKITRKEGF